jgi:hypothetical protein
MITIVSVVMGLLTYAKSFHYWQYRYPTLAKYDYKADLIFSVVIGVVTSMVSIIWLPSGIIFFFFYAFKEHNLALKFK